MQDRLMLTAEGRDRLLAEREALRDEDARLAEALRMPDGADEAPTSAATSDEERRSRIAARIRELDRLLATAHVIESGEIDGETVQPGVTVELRDRRSGATSRWLVVEPPEADPSAGRLSVRSPLGEALLGRRVGDLVQVEAPKGVRTYEIAAIRVGRG